MMPIIVDDGDSLREWRESQFLSQSQLAKLLGVHLNTVFNWEKGKTRIPSHVNLALEQITGNRERLVRRLRSQREKLAHERRMKEIAQDVKRNAKAS